MNINIKCIALLLTTLSAVWLGCAKPTSQPDANSNQIHAKPTNQHEIIVRVNSRTNQAEYFINSSDQKIEVSSLAASTQQLRWEPINTTQIIDDQTGYPNQPNPQLYFLQNSNRSFGIVADGNYNYSNYSNYYGSGYYGSGGSYGGGYSSPYNHYYPPSCNCPSFTYQPSYYYNNSYYYYQAASCVSNYGYGYNPYNYYLYRPWWQ